MNLVKLFYVANPKIIPYFLLPNCQNATAPAQATLRESTPCDMGIFAV